MVMAIRVLKWFATVLHTIFVGYVSTMYANEDDKARLEAFL